MPSFHSYYFRLNYKIDAENPHNFVKGSVFYENIAKKQFDRRRKIRFLRSRGIIYSVFVNISDFFLPFTFLFLHFDKMNLKQFQILFHKNVLAGCRDSNLLSLRPQALE